MKLLENRGLSQISHDRPRDLELLWFRPTGTSWGTSPDLEAAIASIRGAVRRTLSRSWGVRTSLIVPQVSRNENNKRFDRTFDRACFAAPGYLSPALEVVLLKGVAAIVTVCVRLSAATFVPVGFAMVDTVAVNRLEKALRLEVVAGFHQLRRHAIEDDEADLVEPTV